MSDWRGLHNPERHRVAEDGVTECDTCGLVECHPNYLCNCCIASEIETLREERDQARVQVQRVRELCEQPDLLEMSGLWLAKQILAALDGAE